MDRVWMMGSGNEGIMIIKIRSKSEGIEYAIQILLVLKQNCSPKSFTRRRIGSLPLTDLLTYRPTWLKFLFKNPLRALYPNICPTIASPDIPSHIARLYIPGQPLTASNTSRLVLPVVYQAGALTVVFPLAVLSLAAPAVLSPGIAAVPSPGVPAVLSSPTAAFFDEAPTPVAVFIAPPAWLAASANPPVTPRTVFPTPLPRVPTWVCC